MISYILLLFVLFDGCLGSRVPVLSMSQQSTRNKTYNEPLQFLPFIMLIDRDKDTSEYWRETEILSLLRNKEFDIDYEKCEKKTPERSLVQLPSRRTVRPICRGTYDYQLCPQCPRFNNRTECELFRDSCIERKVQRSEYRTYCDKKYGKWRTMFIPADYSQCRCCDECVFYRVLDSPFIEEGYRLCTITLRPIGAESTPTKSRAEAKLDQSCVEDEYNFDTEEFLPVTTIDFRTGCNPYRGHPEQEMRALRCDKILRRCVPVTIPPLPTDAITVRRSFRFEPPLGGTDCPVSCRGYVCQGGLVKEGQCTPGAYLPSQEHCNCCGKCSSYHQLNQKCAEFKKIVHNGTNEIEVEEEFLEPGCDDGLVCRQGFCQDIHSVQTSAGFRRKRDEGLLEAYEPCKQELKHFKKKYGKDGHLHYNAPQCTPLWLYAPVQCRRFVCYCALEDGTFIQGIKVPRVEVSNMNCDCVREKCRTGSNVECDGYGNYKEAIFTAYVEWDDTARKNTDKQTKKASRTTMFQSFQPLRTGYEAALPTKRLF